MRKILKEIQVLLSKLFIFNMNIGSTGLPNSESRMNTSPIHLPPHNSMKNSNISNKGNKLKESLLLRNVYRNDIHTKMLLAKKRREDFMPQDKRNHGT